MSTQFTVQCKIVLGRLGQRSIKRPPPRALLYDGEKQLAILGRRRAIIFPVSRNASKSDAVGTWKLTRVRTFDGKKKRKREQVKAGAKLGEAMLDIVPVHKIYEPCVSVHYRRI